MQLGQLAQVIHVTDDLAGARRFWGGTLGGLAYYEGYSPAERRDATIYAIGDATIEPMTPSDEPGAGDFPVGRFLTRFGPRWQSVAINTADVPDTADELVHHGIRVVGPGGRPLSELSATPPQAVYTHPRDTHFLIELVDFGAPLMPASPRLAADWDPSPWAEGPFGITGLSHVTALVRDVGAATAFFADVFATPVLAEPAPVARGLHAVIRLGTETRIELLEPDRQAPELQALLDRDGEGLLEVALAVRSAHATADALLGAGLTAERRGDEVRVDPARTGGARVVFTATDVTAE